MHTHAFACGGSDAFFCSPSVHASFRAARSRDSHMTDDNMPPSPSQAWPCSTIRSICWHCTIRLVQAQCDTLGSLMGSWVHHNPYNHSRMMCDEGQYVREMVQ